LLAAGAKRVIRHPLNRGLGASTRTGMQRSFEMGADISVKIDADFQHDPLDIKKVIQPIIEDVAKDIASDKKSAIYGIYVWEGVFDRKGNAVDPLIARMIFELIVADKATRGMSISQRIRKYMVHIDAWSMYESANKATQRGAIIGEGRYLIFDAIESDDLKGIVSLAKNVV